MYQCNYIRWIHYYEVYYYLHQAEDNLIIAIIGLVQ